MGKFYKFDFTLELKKMKPAAFKSLQLTARSKAHTANIKKLLKRLETISGDPKVAISSKDKQFSDKLKKDLSKELVTLHQDSLDVIDILNDWRNAYVEFEKSMLLKLKQK